MDLTRPYSWRAEVTEKADGWSDGGTVGGVTGLTVDWDVTDDAPTVASCEVTVMADSPEPPARWARVDLLASQGGRTVRESLGCYRLEVDTARWEDGGWEVTLAGRSVLSPLGDMTMPAGSYAPYGADAAAWCRDLMRRAGMASPVAAETTAMLGENVVFDEDATALEAVWDVLGRCGLTLRLDGDGTTRICGAPATPALSIGPGGTHGTGPSVEVGDGKLTLTREWDPAVATGDLVSVSLPSLGVAGTYESVTQSVDLEKGLEVEETLRRTDDEDR